MTTVFPQQDGASASQPPPYVMSAPAVAYNPALNPAMNPAQISVVHQVLQLQPEQFLTDYRVFSLVITVIFGILGPLSLLTGIPAVLLAVQGHDHMKKGLYETSRTKSVISAYLSFGTMFISILTSSLLICLLLGFRYQISNNY